MQGSDSQVKTLLGTDLKRPSADLSEFMEQFYGKSARSCEPFLRGRGKKGLMKSYFSIARGRFMEK